MNVWALFLSFISSLSVPSCAAKKIDTQAAKNDHKAQVVVLMSTDRPDSNTSRVADNVVAAYQQTGLSAELFKVTDFGADFYAPTAYAQRPEAFTKFKNE